MMAARQSQHPVRPSHWRVTQSAVNAGMHTWSTSSEHAPTAMIVPTIACCVDDSPNEHLAAECTLVVHLIRCPSFRFGLLATSPRHSAILVAIPAAPDHGKPTPLVCARDRHTQKSAHTHLRRTRGLEEP